MAKRAEKATVILDGTRKTARKMKAAEKSAEKPAEAAKPTPAPRKSGGKPKFTTSELLLRKWASASDADAFLAKYAPNYKDHGLVLVMAEGGFVLEKRSDTDAAARRAEKEPAVEETAETKPLNDSAVGKSGDDASTGSDGNAADAGVDGQAADPIALLPPMPETPPTRRAPPGATRYTVRVEFPGNLMSEHDAKTWIAFYGPRYCGMLRLMTEDGEIVESYDYRSAKPIRFPGATAAGSSGNSGKLPRAGVRRSADTSPWGPMRDAAGEMAEKNGGVLRSTLTAELNDGNNNVNWKGLLDQYARRKGAGYVVETVRTDDGPRYSIVQRT